MQYNWVDGVTLALIVLIGSKGFVNGLFRELSGLLGLIAGIWIGSYFAHDLGEWLGAHWLPIHSPSALSMVAFVGLLFFVWLVFVVVGLLVDKYFSIAQYRWVDRILGFVVASSKAFIIVAVIVYALSSIEFVRKNTQKYLRTSFLFPWMIKTGDAILNLEPVKNFDTKRVGKGSDIDEKEPHAK